jgi:predicted Zn-dependent peptidase
VYERRLTTSERQYQRAENPVKRNMQALLFGPSHRYGSPPAATTPTLAALEQLRDRVFVTSASTLVVVGDTTQEAVKRTASRTFSRWSRHESAGSVAAAPPPPPLGPHIVFAPNPGIDQVWGSVAARGPAPHDPETPAYLVLAKLLGGRTDSASFSHVREDMKAAYTIGGEVDSYEDVSVMSLTGSFDRDSVAIGMQGLLDSVASARDAAPSAEDLDRAKTVVIAELSRAIATDEGFAATLGNAFLLGLNPQAVQDRFALVKAVSAADVHAVARRYLAPDCVRVVLMGKPEAISDARGLGLGEPVATDGFGRLLPARGKPAARR